VAGAKYDAATRTLAGKSVRLVSGVPFKYAFYVPDGMRLREATFDGKPAEVKAEGNLAIVTFIPGKSEIEWRLRF
jgi:hypothetical protein